MFKKIFLIIFFSSFILSAQPGRQYGKQQNKENIIYGKVEGFVKDKKNKSDLNYANITLLKQNEIVNGTITNEKGFFVFSELEPAEYVIQVS